MQWHRKIIILYYLLADQIRGWKTEVWDKDLDELYCCDGRECACGGATIGDIFSNCLPSKN